jgi:uncharacterized membrane protein YGL010W
METSHLPDAAVTDRDSMTFGELVVWAWSETPPVHKSAVNLIIHIIAVPLFVLGHLLLLAAIVLGWWFATVGGLSIIVSFALQGYGHSVEKQKVPAFTGPRDFLRRLYAEQFCNFWRFLFSGLWFSSLRARKSGRVA